MEYQAEFLALFVDRSKTQDGVHSTLKTGRHANCAHRRYFELHPASEYELALTLLEIA